MSQSGTCVILRRSASKERRKTMSWWNLAPESMIFPDEGYLTDSYPQHVAKAFLAVDFDESDVDAMEKSYVELAEEAMVAFAHRWGGLDDATFLRVLQQGKGRDRLVAIFAIGHSALPQAAELLAPLLESADFLERCAAACMLALRRDERALPVLVDYLQHDAPTEDRGGYRRPVRGVEIWYNSYRSKMVGLLATWGPDRLTSLLRQVFLKMWDQEYTQGKWTTHVEYAMHDALLYALGRRGALAALHGVKLTASRQRLAMIYLALGSLRADERVTDPLDNELLIRGSLTRGLEAEVAAMLSEHFALTEQEARSCVDSYYQDYQTRMDAPLRLKGVREEEPIPAWEERARQFDRKEKS
jgi:hypothetical protein